MVLVKPGLSVSLNPQHGNSLQGSLGYGTGLEQNSFSESVYSDIGISHPQETNAPTCSFGGEGVAPTIPGSTAPPAPPPPPPPFPTTMPTRVNAV
jgi:hypothetical protein